MKNKVVAALALLVGMAGASAQAGKIDREPIEVTVVDGKPFVAEEEAHNDGRHVALVWTAPPGHTFPADGIVFDVPGKKRLNCFPTRKGRLFRCEKKGGHFKGERYKYVVKLVETASGKLLPELDPFVVND
ncbi:conserved exported hypothetical protein [Rubrivivax sp. A210]|uniref:hypothetical protein n=1 Tax=Rubrivivax sp. A210 TaxID=2772301 RepID=UPI0019185FCC|nr:hypothetical protein [Rubrivivax sp. A210]CAD5369090.1 conserved exported hypothetical protein [Rubrivivax sp. A210]